MELRCVGRRKAAAAVAEHVITVLLSRGKTIVKAKKKNAIVPVRGINKRWDDGGGWPLCVDRRESFAIYLTFYTSVFVFISTNSHKRDRAM